MRKEWTESEVSFLKEYFPKQGRKYCGEKLNRSVQSIRRKADVLGLKLEKGVRNKISREGCMQSNKDKIRDRTQEKAINFQGYEMIVIESNGALNLTVQFNDSRKSIRNNISYQEFINGSVKNLYHPDVYGVGYFGDGIYTARVDGKMSKCYNTWVNMLGRCYDRLHPRRQTSYDGVTVCEEWFNFQNFAEWFYNNYESSFMQNWHLDKDLLCFSCRMYSPETCSLLPSEVNVIFQSKSAKSESGMRGVYKAGNMYLVSISKFGKQNRVGSYKTLQEARYAYSTAKKDYLYEVSNRWRGILSDKTCDSIRNFDVNLL